MVNMGRIHRELGKYLMISSNLIKSDDESMIEIGKNNFMKENSKTIPQNQKSSNLTLISRRNWRSKWDKISKNRKNEINENQDEIKLNY